MIRTTLTFVIAATLAAPVALADDPPPTKQELEAAKQAFQQGNALYKAGKLDEAVEQLKESYRLSRNAFLLYNIGHIYDQLGQKDLVVFYFKKFLADAPANAPMRAEVTERVAELEKQLAETTATPQATEEEPPAEQQTSIDFRHQLVESAPPGVPFDVTAMVPEGSDVTVTLFFRGSGDVKFTSRPMVWREKELVGHIPAARMAGNWIQYYIEVRDKAGNLVTRAGKSTSPNLIVIENDAKPHFYPDLVEPGENTTPVRQSDPEAPTPGSTDATAPEGRTSLLPAAKWASTGAAAAFLGTSLVSYLIASNQHDLLVADAHSCGTPPCREFDAEYGQKVEARGVRYDTIYKVTLGIGIGAAALAGYLWYRDVSRKKSQEPALVVAPVIDGSGAGATAVVRF